LQELGYTVNRVYSPYAPTKKEITYIAKNAPCPEKFTDNDAYGFMETQSDAQADKKRSPVEVNQAVSMTPFENNRLFYSTAGEKKEKTSVHGVEFHPCRYQFSFGIRPIGFAVKSNIFGVIESFKLLNRVGGNHARFMYDFSPESVIFRVTHDFAHRSMNCMRQIAGGRVEFNEPFLNKVEAGDVDLSEFYIGGYAAVGLAEQMKTAGIDPTKFAYFGKSVMKAFEMVCDRLEKAGIKR